MHGIDLDLKNGRVRVNLNDGYVECELPKLPTTNIVEYCLVALEWALTIQKLLHGSARKTDSS